MNFRQKMLRKVYPLLIRFSRITGMQNSVVRNRDNKRPVTSIYDYQVTLTDGRVVSLSDFRNMKILIVNTASECGYTGQLDTLQELFTRYADELMVIGFPSNDFREQEKGSDAEIAEFCKRNFGVSFLLSRKTSVLPGMGQHPIYQWLSDPQLNGWNDRAPVWNFTKYLINEQGVLTHYFEPSVDPAGSEISGLFQTTIKAHSGHFS